MYHNCYNFYKQKKVHDTPSAHTGIILKVRQQRLLKNLKPTVPWYIFSSFLECKKFSRTSTRKGKTFTGNFFELAVFDPHSVEGACFFLLLRMEFSCNSVFKMAQPEKTIDRSNVSVGYTVTGTFLITIFPHKVDGWCSSSKCVNLIFSMIIVANVFEIWIATEKSECVSKLHFASMFLFPTDNINKVKHIGTFRNALRNLQQNEMRVEKYLMEEQFPGGRLEKCVLPKAHNTHI